MSLGFEQAGFRIVAALDSDPIHLATYARNFPDTMALCADLSETHGHEILRQAGLRQGRIEVLFGGPPCQGFSLIGKRRKDDSRNGLIYHFARLVREVRPLYFVMENVEGLMRGGASDSLQSFVRRVERSGYKVVRPIRSLDASQFGVPQRRKRVFVIGYRKDLPALEYPRALPAGDGARNCPTVWDAIGDLPNVDDCQQLLAEDVYHGPLGQPSEYAGILRGETADDENRSHRRPRRLDGLTGYLRTVHSEKTVSRFAQTLPGSYEPVSRFYRLTKGGVAPTLRAGTGPGHGSFTAPRPIHPIYARCITVREAARLHSFPDWFRFHPTKWHGFREVGNSVPPLLARAVARSLIAHLT